jgi:hypothetical protein
MPPSLSGADFKEAMRTLLSQRIDLGFETA